MLHHYHHSTGSNNHNIRHQHHHHPTKTKVIKKEANHRLLLLDSIPEYTSFQDMHTTLYAERWLVLASFALLSFTSSWIWITWSPLTVLVAEAWQVHPSAVDALSGIYMYIYVLGSFVSLYWVVNYGGLYRGLAAGATLNMAGACIRYWYAHDYTMVYMGTVLCALAQTFTLSTPPLIAASWFGDQERATATALGVLANQMGTAAGLGMTFLIDFTTTTTTTATTTNEATVDDTTLQWSTLSNYLQVQMWVAVTALILIISFVSDRPPTSPRSMTRPTPTATHTDPLPDIVEVDESAPLISVEITPYETFEKVDETLNYVESIRLVMRNPHHCMFLLCFALTVGVFYTIPTFLSQLVPSTWSLRNCGLLGMAFQLSGTVGSLTAGRMIDITNQHKLVALVILCGGLLSTLMLAFTLDDSNTQWISESSWRWMVSLILATMGSGCTLAAWNSVGLEYAAVATYPAHEAAVAGLLECAAELAAFVLVSLGGWWLGAEGSGASTFVLVLALIVWLSMIVFVCTPDDTSHRSFATK
jgi:MFS family permease